MIVYSNLQCLNIPTVTGRQLIGIDVQYNSNIYNWIVYAPLVSGEDLINYLNQISNIVELDIEFKENIWNNSSKKETIIDPISGKNIEIDIPKERIVIPTIPDYIEILASVGHLPSQIEEAISKLGDNYWQYPQYAKRIIAPVSLIMDDVGVKMYNWFQLNMFPILKFGNNVHLYCNTILPEHQAIVDSLQGIIIIEDRP